MTKTYTSYWSHLHVIEKSVSEIVSFLYLRATYVKAEKNVYIETVIFILHYVPYQIRRCRCNFFLRGMQQCWLNFETKNIDGIICLDYSLFHFLAEQQCFCCLWLVALLMMHFAWILPLDGHSQDVDENE